MKGFEILDLNEKQAYRENYCQQSIMSLSVGILFGCIVLALIVYLFNYSLKHIQQSPQNSTQSFKFSLIAKPQTAKNIEPFTEAIEPAPPKPQELEQPPRQQEANPKHNFEQVARAEPPIPERQPNSPPIKATVGKFIIQNTRLPATEPKAFSGVFDSKLRQRLNQSTPANSQSLATKPLSVYQENDGSEVVQLDGKCFTVVKSDMSPTGKQWSLPTNCMGHLTESDRITTGLKAAMKMRFGEHTRN